MIASEVRTTLDTMQLLSDDVIVVAYPKSGTTWMQQIVKLIGTSGIESGIRSYSRSCHGALSSTSSYDSIVSSWDN